MVKARRNSRRGIREITTRSLPVVLAILLAAPSLPPPRAQEAQSQAQETQTEAPPFKPEELEQIVAPIALYPDPLLAQVLMASTYPLEVVEAARFVEGEPEPQGRGARRSSSRRDVGRQREVAGHPSPRRSTMMNEKLDWMQKLGDAFLAQQKDLMDAIQRLRAKARRRRAI